MSPDPILDPAETQLALKVFDRLAQVLEAVALELGANDRVRLAAVHMAHLMAMDTSMAAAGHLEANRAAMRAVIEAWWVLDVQAAAAKLHWPAAEMPR
jgi:hypothetical protein